MVLEGETKKLKIVVGETDRVYQRPLYEAIVFAAKKYKMAGVTVLKGVMSYGANSVKHSTKIFTLAADVPMVIELVDREERIRSFADIVGKLFDKAQSGGVVYIESVELIRYC